MQKSQGDSNLLHFSQELLMQDESVSVISRSTSEPRIQLDQSRETMSDCIYHPRPYEQTLPSGLRRQQMEHPDESPSQADRQRRNEIRAIVHEHTLVRPRVCHDHKFCLANVPHSPKELFASRSDIRPQTSSFDILIGSDKGAQEDEFHKSFVKKKQKRERQFVPGLVLQESQGQGQFIQISEIDTSSVQNESINQVSFNIRQAVAAKSGNKGPVANQRVPDAAFSRDLSFNVLGSGAKDSSRQPINIQDLSGIHPQQQHNLTTNQIDPNQQTHPDQELRDSLSSQSLEQKPRRSKQFKSTYKEESAGDKSLALISACRKSRVTDDSKLNPWEKVVVTEEGIDNWRAQLYSLDIKTFPKIRPDGVPLDIFNELKKKYVVLAAIKQPKKGARNFQSHTAIDGEDETDPALQQRGIKSRYYMDWHAKLKARGGQKSKSPDRKRGGGQKEGDRKAGQKAVKQSDLEETLGIEDNLLIQTQESQPAHEQVDHLDKLATKEQHALNLQQTRQVPGPKSYKTAVFNKNSRVEDLLSVLEPTPEQAIIQAARQAQAEADERARIENIRKERNRKTKVALTQKQKVHAEKLYQSLGGVVSRKEIEKSAFNVNALMQHRREAQKEANLTSNQQSRSMALLPHQQTSLLQQQPTAMSGEVQLSHKFTKRTDTGLQKKHHTAGASTAQGQVTRATSRPMSSMGRQLERNHQVSSYQQSRSLARVASFATAQKQPQSVWSSSVSRLGLRQASSSLMPTAPAKSIYKVFGVKSSQIGSKRVVQSRPLSSFSATQNRHRSALRANVKQDNQTTTITTVASEASFVKPPIHGGAHRSTIKVVNARSTAAKLVLRQRAAKQIALNKFSSTDEQSVSVQSLQSQQTIAQPQGQSQTLPPRESHLSTSFLGPYLAKPSQNEAYPTGHASQVTIAKKLQSSIMHAGRTKSERTLAQGSNHSDNQGGIADLGSRKEHQNYQSFSILMKQKETTGLGDSSIEQNGLDSKPSLVQDLFPQGQSYDPATGLSVSGLKNDQFISVGDQVTKSVEENEFTIREKLNSIVVSQEPMRRREFAHNTFYQAGEYQKLSVSQNRLREMKGRRSQAEADLATKLIQTNSQKTLNAKYLRGQRSGSQTRVDFAALDQAYDREPTGKRRTASSLQYIKRSHGSSVVEGADKQEFAAIMKHVTEHGKTQQQYTRVGLLKQGQSADNILLKEGNEQAETRFGGRSSSNQLEEPGVQAQSLTNLQQCSNLFRDFQGEFKDYQKEQAIKDEEERERNAKKKEQAGLGWAVDSARYISKKVKDQLILKGIMDKSLSPVKETRKDVASIKFKEDIYVNDNAYLSSRQQPSLEQMAGEQQTPSRQASSRGGGQASGHKKWPSSKASFTKLGEGNALGQVERKQSSEKSLISELIDQDEQIRLANAHLYLEDPSYDLEEMLLDESEDELEQVNFEIDQHRTKPIDLDNSHQYRNAIKEGFFAPEKASKMTTEQKEQLNASIRDADFWLTKGISMTAHNQLSTAIQCYKQTLLLNEDHYVAMHNLGVCYERLEKLSSALKWFKRASYVKPTMHFTFIGAAINYFKLGRYSLASDFVRAAIIQVEREKTEKYETLSFVESDDEEPYYREKSKSLRATINDYNYILSLCLRRVRSFAEAGELYLSNSWFYRYPEKIDMVNSLFGLLLLPMVKDRRVIADELEIIKDNLKMYRSIRNPIKRPLYGTFYNKKQWIMKFKERAAEELRQKSFFKRFTNADLVKFLPKMKVRQYEPNSVIFPDFDVCIILDGLVESKFHVFGDRIPKPLSKFTEGDVLGFASGDNGTTSHVETWSIARSQVEVIWMNRADFQALWTMQNKSTKKMLCQVVRMQKCFQGFNDLTVHMLAFELLKTRDFTPGAQILPMNKRSRVNELHRSAMVTQTNAILKSVLKQREDLDRGGRDLRVSSWQLMLGSIAGHARREKEAREKAMLKRKALAYQHTLEVRGIYKPSPDNSLLSSDASIGQIMEHQAEISNVYSSHSSPRNLNPLQKRMRAALLGQGGMLSGRRKTGRDGRYPEDGLYIIDSGRCKILHQDETGKKRLVAVIGRNDAFGAAQRTKLATLDYLGEVQAGGEINISNGASGVSSGVATPVDLDRIVTCWYLSADDMRRIPEHELKGFRDVMYSQCLPFMQIGARKNKLQIEEISRY